MSIGQYGFKAVPTENKAWEDASKIEVVLNLECEHENKTFRGLLDLAGIVRRAV